MKIIIILSALITFSIFNSVQSQISIKLGPQLGLTSPTMDYSGDAKDFYTGTKYGLRSGLHYGVMGKVQLGPLNGRLSLSYSSLDNNGPTGEPNSTVEIKNNLFMFTLGTEFGFGIPMSPVKPYAGIDILFTTISGSFNFSGSTPNGLSGGTKNIESASRTGLGFSIGSEIGFGRQFTLDLSLRYNLINLFGKEYTPSANNSKTDVYAFLNDAKDPNFNANDPKHPIANDRSITTIQINAALLFGF